VTDSDVDPVIVALSDLLVMTALERAWARAVKRARYAVPPQARHHQYMQINVSEDQMTAALRDAWALAPTLQARHRLDLDPSAWADVLNGYTRALLMMRVSHHPDRLRPLLAPLIGVTDDGWTRRDAAHG
jgi:hypothetical protein